MNNLKIRPINHRVLIEERKFEEKSKGGIYFAPNKVAEYQAGECEGTIIALANDAFDYMPEDERPKVGDIVHFIKYEGYLREYDGRNYRIILDEMICAVADKYLNKEESIING